MRQPPYRILVIDDDARLLQVLSDSLHLFGAFEVMGASDGAAGLELCLTKHPDVVIIDVRMPQLDGYQVVRALRGDSSTEHLPLIILSAMVEERDQLSGIFAGADAYLEKPLHPHKLVEAIHQVLQTSHHQRTERMRHLAEQDQ